MRAAEEGRIEVVASPLLLGEFRGVLRRDRFRRFLSLGEADELTRHLGTIFRIEEDPAPGSRVLRDPKDDYILRLAQHISADYIVSGDADLTDETLVPPAITPREAVELSGLD